MCSVRTPSHSRHRLALVAAGALALSLGPWAALSGAATSTLLRYPYLSEVVGNSATLNWATDRSATTGSASWGAVVDGACSPSHAVTASRTAITIGSLGAYQWSARLDLPAPGSYCYRVQLGPLDLLGPEPSPRLETAARTAPFSFGVVGDFGAASTGEANVFSQIAKSPASFVVSTGDSDNTDGTQSDYGDLAGGTVFASRYLPRIASRPIFAAQGNHGFSTNLPYLQNFPAPLAAAASGGRNQQDTYCCVSTLSGPKKYASSWYAFDWGGARFYVLEAAWADSQGAYQGDYLAHWNGPVAGCGPCGAEASWLKADLEAHASTPLKFAFFHYPLHSDSHSQPSDKYLDGAGRLEGLLAANHVDIVFNGHAHIYERNRPEIAGSPMVSYITGGGGAALGSVGGCSAFDAYAIGKASSCHAPEPASEAQVYEFLLVTVEGDKVTVAPTDSTGQVFDKQTYTFESTAATVIDASPPALTNSTSAEIAFHSTGGAASFTCSLDGAPSVACTSPVTYSALAPGHHEVTVAATGASPVSASWRVDTTPPSVPTALSAVAGPGAVTLSWAPSSDDTGVTGYDIYRDGRLVASSSASTTRYLDAGLDAATTYAYAVAARDGAGNVSAESSPVSVTTPAVSMAPALVQSASSLTKTITLPAPSRPGDLLVLTAGLYTGATQPITAVSDGANSWKRAGAYYVSGHYSDGEIWYAAGTSPVQAITVTTAAGSVALELEEFSGVAATDPLDRTAGTAGSGTAPSSGQVVPSTGAELAVGFVAGHGSAQPITVSEGGYELAPQVTTTSPSTVSVRMGHTLCAVGVPQAFAGTFPSSMYWAAGIVVFKPAA